MRTLLRKNIWFEREIWDYLKELGASKARTPSQTVADLIMKELLAERIKQR